MRIEKFKITGESQGWPVVEITRENGEKEEFVEFSDLEILEDATSLHILFEEAGNEYDEMREMIQEATYNFYIENGFHFCEGCNKWQLAENFSKMFEFEEEEGEQAEKELCDNCEQY